MADASNGHHQRTSDDQQPGQRAEEVLEDWGRRAGRFVAAAAARVREEAEDILAEAQSIRRGERD